MKMRLKQMFLLLGLAIGGVCLYLVLISFRDTEPFSTDINTQHYKPSHSSLKRMEMLVDNNSEVTGKTSNVEIEEDELISVAKKVASHNKTVLVTMVNDAYLPFTYSWLCNTKDMNIHKSVLIITTDETSKINLERDWHDISVVSMQMLSSGGDQVYSQAGYVKIMVKRTEMLLSILMADMEIFLFEVDCLWLANPTPILQNMKGVDILVNPVAGTNSVYAGGFLYLFPTPKGKALWKKVTEMMVNLGERLSKMKDNQPISEGDNDQQYLSRLINQKYADITYKVLSLDDYADGKWYEKSEEVRKKLHPLVINNNWVMGNQAKIKRAKEWKHWFIDDNRKCDMELVRQTVYH